MQDKSTKKTVSKTAKNSKKTVKNVAERIKKDPIFFVEGIITKISGLKTRRVEYSVRFWPAKYKKSIVHKKKVIAHDESNESKLGQKVKVYQCRPMSKIKRHFLVVNKE